MPSIQRTCVGVLAASCALSAISPSDAFWLIPSTRRLDVLGRRSPAEALQHSTREESRFADLMQALDEMSTDLSSSATRAKSVMMRGTYLRETDDAYVLSMDVPGLYRNELTVAVERGTLHIRGEHDCPALAPTNVSDPLCIARSYDATFTFPSDAADDDSVARLEAGVVHVKVPKIKDDERRGIGRVLKLTEDAADWVYTGTGAKSAVHAAADAMGNIKDSVQQAGERVVGAAGQATASIQSAGSQATDAAGRAAQAAKDTAYDASRRAQQAVYDAASNAQNAARDTAAHAQNAARDASSNAQNAARDAAINAQNAVRDASNKAQHAGEYATDMVRNGAHSVTDAYIPHPTDAAILDRDGKGFVERVQDHLHENVVKPIRQRMGGKPGTEGEIPVQVKDEL